MENIKVYIAFHQQGNVLARDEVYLPLQVGKSTSQLNLEMENDATGENMSDRNDIYSELTGWFWIWKNKKHDIIGTCHYRRYFTFEPASFLRRLSKLLLFFIGLQKKRHGLFYVSNSQHARNKILTSAQIMTLMQQYDVILPSRKKFKYSVYEQYKRRHNEQDIGITREIIQEKYPEYLNAFDEIFRSREMYSFNMFIMHWEFFDKYMNWLFSVLNELEK